MIKIIHTLGRWKITLGTEEAKRITVRNFLHLVRLANGEDFDMSGVSFTVEQDDLVEALELIRK